MKYKYYDGAKRLIAESDSPIQFSEVLLPAWNEIKPVVDEPKVKAKKKKEYWEKDKTQEANE